MTDQPTDNAPDASLAALAEALLQEITGLCRSACTSCDAKRAAVLAALRRVQTERQQEVAIDCPLCGVTVPLVASATLSLALWQHVNWVCTRGRSAGPQADQDALGSARTLAEQARALHYALDSEACEWPTTCESCEIIAIALEAVRRDTLREAEQAAYATMPMAGEGTTDYEDGLYQGGLRAYEAIKGLRQRAEDV